MKNQIIVNADDFGWDKSCSEAILSAFESGYISTSTMCVNGAYFEEAVSLVKNSPYRNQIGIHINLTEGRPLTDGIRKNPLFCDAGGNYIGFPHLYRRLSAKDKKDIRDEMIAQITKFKSTGLNIHHVDSHHHIHNAINIFEIYLAVMKAQGISKIRKFRNIGKIIFPKKIAKSFYNSRLKKNGFAYTDFFGDVCDYKTLNDFKYQDQIIELMTHPDFDSDGVLIDRDPSSAYEKPFGPPLKDMIALISEKGDVLI